MPIICPYLHNLYSKKKFHGISCVVGNHLKGSILRVPDSTDLELIHLVNKDTTPQLNIIGIYLDVEARQNVEETGAIWGKLTCKIDSIIQKGEAVALIGDMNRPLFNTNMSKGTKLLHEYLEEGTLRLINTNIPTRIDPGTKKGSVLDLCLTSINIDKCITGFEIDTNCTMTPFSITKTKNNLVSKYTDHNATMVKIKII